MNLAIYKPNRNNSGFAFNFQVGIGKGGEPVLYVTAIAQHSWDSKKRIGSFSENRKDPEKNASIKFNEFECGEILSCLKNRYVYETFHAFDDNKTIIRFTPWDKETKITHLEKEKGTSEIIQKTPAFGLVITRNGNQTFRLPLSPGECECLISLLGFLLNKIYLFREQKSAQFSGDHKTNTASQSIATSDEPPF